jgi:hypothetical protein
MSNRANTGGNFARKPGAREVAYTALLLGTMIVATACGGGRRVGAAPTSMPNRAPVATMVPDINNGQDLLNAEARLKGDILDGKSVTINLGAFVCDVGKGGYRMIVNPVETVVDGQEVIGSLTRNSDNSVDVQLMQLSNPGAPVTTEPACYSGAYPGDPSGKTMEVVFRQGSEVEWQNLPVTPYTTDGVPATTTFGDVLPTGMISSQE